MNDAGPHSAGSIPDVDFYGVDDAWPTSERLHSEALIDRSARHNWVIKPHRHNHQAQIFAVLDGSGVARLDSVRQRVHAPAVIVVPERCVHEFEWSSDCGGYVLSIASPLLGKLKQHARRLRDVFTTPVAASLGAEGAALGRIMSRIHAEYGKSDSLRELALESLLMELAVCLARSISTSAEPTGRNSRGSRHYRRFLKLVEEQHKAQWPVSRYASAIGVTPPHLNAICKQYDGRSASHVVHDRLLLAARRGLAYTDNSIAGVARSLGFADPSYFSRFFKRSEGVTPSLFRQQSGTQAVSGR